MLWPTLLENVIKNNTYNTVHYSTCMPYQHVFVCAAGKCLAKSLPLSGESRPPRPNRWRVTPAPCSSQLPSCRSWRNPRKSEVSEKEARQQEPKKRKECTTRWGSSPLPPLRPLCHNQIHPGSHHCWIFSRAPGTGHHMHQHSASKPKQQHNGSVPQSTTTTQTFCHLPQTPPVWRTRSSWDLVPPLPHALHNIHNYIYLCLHLCPVLHLPTALDKVEPSMAFTEKLNWRRERGPCKPNDYWESVFLSLNAYTLVEANDNLI